MYPGFLTEAEGNSLIEEAGRRFKRRRFENGHWDSVITGYREVELSTPDDQCSRQDFDTKVGGTVQVPLYVRAIQRTRKQLEKFHFNNGRGSSGDAASNNIRWLPCHAIDLSANGKLKPHVDSVKFSGEVVAGLSLLSDAIMRLKPSAKEWENMENDTNHGQVGGDSIGHVDLYLPKLSLYVLSGMSRYSYTHELLHTITSFEFMAREDKGENIVDTSYGIEKRTAEVLRGRRLSIIFRDAKNI